jgi:hypothetical protein
MNNVTALQPIDQNYAVAEQSSFGSQGLLLDFEKVRAMQALAEIMSTAAVAVPTHFRNKPGDCLAVVMQSAQWGMNPFAVAQKTYIVNGALGYEAQLVNAVVQSSGSIHGRFLYEYQGDGANVSCRVGAVIKGEKEITWGEWLSAATVTTKNSPLWKTNPKQQLGYLQVKNWARAFCPGAILGVYSDDELEAMPEINMGAAEIVTEQPATKTDAVKSKLGITKKADAVTLEKVLDAIAKATTPEQITDTAKLAAKLTDGDDKAKAGEAYKARVHALKEQANSASDPDDEALKTVEKAAPVITYAQVAEKLQKAADVDLLGAAADLIGEISDEGQRAELGDMYRARLEEFRQQ